MQAVCRLGKSLGKTGWFCVHTWCKNVGYTILKSINIFKSKAVCVRVRTRLRMFGHITWMNHHRECILESQNLEDERDPTDDLSYPSHFLAGEIQHFTAQGKYLNWCQTVTEPKLSSLPTPSSIWPSSIVLAKSPEQALCETCSVILWGWFCIHALLPAPHSPAIPAGEMGVVNFDFCAWMRHCLMEVCGRGA